jgi:hypothetical protein
LLDYTDATVFMVEDRGGGGFEDGVRERGEASAEIVARRFLGRASLAGGW